MNAKNRIEQRVFQLGYVDKLYRNLVSTNNFDDYKLDSFPFEQKFPKGNTGIFLDEGFALDADKSDFENSVLLYDNLKHLNETEASDERLWVYLTHVTFWEYMRKRWPIENVENPASRIRERYFMRGSSIESITRSGIARLWWYAHLTYDESRQNKYELTEVLLKRADLSVGITERALGSNRSIRTALLEFLKANPDISSDQEKTRDIFKGLNLVGGVRQLPFLEITDLMAVLEQVKLQL